MEKWQQRVIIERDELSDRLLRLAAFLSNGACEVSGDDYMLLRRQRNAMLDYIDVLAERIRRF